MGFMTQKLKSRDSHEGSAGIGVPDSVAQPSEEVLLPPSRHQLLKVTPGAHCSEVL
jgi:hypothetical protein